MWEIMEGDTERVGVGRHRRGFMRSGGIGNRKDGAYDEAVAKGYLMALKEVKSMLRELCEEFEQD